MLSNYDHFGTSQPIGSNNDVFNFEYVIPTSLEIDDISNINELDAGSHHDNSTEETLIFNSGITLDTTKTNLSNSNLSTKKTTTELFTTSNHNDFFPLLDVDYSSAFSDFNNTDDQEHFDTIDTLTSYPVSLEVEEDKRFESFEQLDSLKPEYQGNSPTNSSSSTSSKQSSNSIFSAQKDGKGISSQAVSFHNEISQFKDFVNSSSSLTVEPNTKLQLLTPEELMLPNNATNYNLQDIENTESEHFFNIDSFTLSQRSLSTADSHEYNQKRTKRKSTKKRSHSTIITSTDSLTPTTKKVSDSRLSADGLAKVLKLSSPEEALERERYILNIFEHELHYPLGYKTWIRDTTKDYRTQLIEALHERVKEKYPEYDHAVLETIIRRATYYMMQSRLRRERRAKSKGKCNSNSNSNSNSNININETIDA
ncbi:uncharacterized protein NDAI_0A05450 [Naumovozyma dairenensis CBS 421]|uniref:Uncharacterized protein n=1 Tax=Naumovozyma dairenensis (strain ATCC 10597 / BCRC 20456 / CBS 421 / NBRC 0211 / NRRL Y-12639) TaxID=1071378 RepID=G0W4G2_NAUDC|nr:hypothetical protein NDAI_0A05450 [Naumovozyma dairenensis CBS 421]CCD22700.1 hypothetical protein NDAI_0A05450 [Naumovozyma dairenensis CBS 421]